MQCTVSMLVFPNDALTSFLLRNVLAAFKRPRFKKVGMKRACKKKLEASEPLPEIESIDASAGNDERLVVAAPAAPLALVAPAAPPDALQQELDAALAEEQIASAVAQQLQKDERRADVAFEVVKLKHDAALNRLDKRVRLKDKSLRPSPFERLRIASDQGDKMYAGHIAAMTASLARAETAAEFAEAKVAVRDIRIRMLQREIRRLKKSHVRRPRVRAGE